MSGQDTSSGGTVSLLGSPKGSLPAPEQAQVRETHPPATTTVATMLSLASTQPSWSSSGAPFTHRAAGTPPNFQTTSEPHRPDDMAP